MAIKYYVCAMLAVAQLSALAGARKCPERCRCRLDQAARRTVECDAARLGTAVPIFDMSKDTQVVG